MNMFEQATKMKLRFETSKGPISVEDLWDLPLEKTNGISLDSLAIACNRKLKETSEESFVAKRTEGNETDQLRMDILKHIIGYRLEQKEAQQKAAEKRSRRNNIDALIAQKQQKELEGKSLEELQAMRDELV